MNINPFITKIIRQRRAIVEAVALTVIVLVAAYAAPYAVGQVMTGGSYRIQSDSINFGGVRSESESYSLEDTAGEIATGVSSGSAFKVNAGFQQMQESIISITAASDVVMSPAIGGVTGGTSNGSTSFTVITDNPAGYMVTVRASTSPAMQSEDDTIADFGSPASSPSFAFSADASESVFGFSPEGDDIADSFRDDGASCGSGSDDTEDACWAGLSTASQTIVSRTSANHVSGTQTTLKFRVTVGSARIQAPGTYIATTTVTAIAI